MSVVKRFNRLLGLDTVDVFVDEVDTSRHIIITDMPESLPQGKSSFLIEVSPYMRDGIELQMDFIDSSGNSIYMWFTGGSPAEPVNITTDRVPALHNWKLNCMGEYDNPRYEDALSPPGNGPGYFSIQNTGTKNIIFINFLNLSSWLSITAKFKKYLYSHSKA